MTNKNNLQRTLQYTLIAFLTLLVLFFFAYFMPVKIEHSKIAKLPSHDLTLFADEHGRFAYNDQFDNITYDGQPVRTKEDFINVLNNDTFVGSRGYHYFYDAQNNLYLRLGADEMFWRGDGNAMFSIVEYLPFTMYYVSPFDPLWRGLALGPIHCLLFELSAENSGTSGTITSARYDFLYPDLQEDFEVSVLSASLQLAFAFTLYFIPAIACLFWRNKKIILCTIGLYILLGVANTAYYLFNYPWLSW